MTAGAPAPESGPGSGLPTNVAPTGPGPLPKANRTWLRITPVKPPAPVPAPVPDDSPGPLVIWAMGRNAQPQRQAHSQNRRFG